MKHLLFLSLLMTTTAYAQFDNFDNFGGGSDSTLASACKQTGFSCGECETGLQDDLNGLISDITGGQFKKNQHWGDGKETSTNPANIPMKAGATLDSTLQGIIDIMKKNNPLGENKLNFVVIGESESLQGSSVRDGKMYPRVMLKSPNSELMVTFNTDPKAKGYNTLEIMRWNGKQGRYEFQELNFGENGEKPHVDATGGKCIECHKESPRPNWDTYRAWAGVVPSRDDMLEMHGSPSGFDKSKGLMPDGRAYINFLDQIANDKDKKIKSRLAMLDIPFDTKRQLGPYVEKAGKQKFTAREQVDIIKEKIAKDGFYRIRHFPDKEEAQEASYSNRNGLTFNFDGKTAEWAGPSQFAFDQMLSQNMCKVTTDLKKHKDWDKFKYSVALLMACGKEGDMESVYPPSAKNRMLDFYAGNNYATLQDIDPKLRPKGRLPGFDQLNSLLQTDTRSSHDAANGFKFNRHGRFVSSFLQNVEGLSPAEAQEKAKYYAEQVKTPTMNGWHAIGDEGGVKGVPEDSTGIMADTRMLLEPFGVNVGHWSLVHGKSNAYNSFSFSDQFSLFKSQPVWAELKREAGSCAELENKARAALSEPNETKPEENENSSAIATICAQIGRGVNDPLEGSNVLDFEQIMQQQMKTSMKSEMKRCLNCHGPGEDPEFKGLEKFVKGNDDAEFISFLSTARSSQFDNMSFLEIMQIKLGVLPQPSNQDVGDLMPPTAWSDNKQYAKTHNIPENKVNDYRRQQLGMWLTFTANGGNRDKMKQFCDSINVGNYIKDFTQPVQSGGFGSGAGAQ